MRLLSTGDNTMLISTAAFHCWGKYFHLGIMAMASSKIHWYGTVNQKVHQPVLPWLTTEQCSKQGSWLHLWFAPNASYRSWISFRTLFFASSNSGHDVAQPPLCSGRSQKRWFCQQMLYWHLSSWPRHLLRCSDAVLHFHITWGRDGIVLNEGGQQDPHRPHPTCWEVLEDYGLYYQVLES